MMQIAIIVRKGVTDHYAVEAHSFSEAITKIEDMTPTETVVTETSFEMACLKNG